MGFAAKIDHHATLFQRMADTVHADLGDALIEGRIDGQALRAAVFQCMNCDGADKCPGWMDAHAEGAAQAPGYCRNGPMLQRITA